MKKFRLSALWFVGTLCASIHSGSGQVTTAPVQSVPARPVVTRSVPAARGVPKGPVTPYVVRGRTSFTPRSASAYVPRMLGEGIPNPRPNYSVVTVNPTVASVASQPIRRTGEQQGVTVDPAIRQNELRTLAAMRERRSIPSQDPTLAAVDTERHVINHNPVTQPQSNTHDSLDPAKSKSHKTHERLGYSDAFRRHWHEWHDRNWWHGHCDTIVFVSTGYYFLDGSYWYPAWGYDPSQGYYDYDGPVYTYGDLLPDEVISNVQTALQGAGYYFGTISGSLGVDTRAALANFQRDYNLQITGAIDEPTIEALGLN